MILSLFKWRGWVTLPHLAGALGVTRSLADQNDSTRIILSPFPILKMGDHCSNREDIYMYSLEDIIGYMVPVRQHLAEV